VSIAFFDIDGTLVPHPSLEKRFFSSLLLHGKIPFGNFLRWAAQMVAPGRRDLLTALQSNKMYLRGIPASVLSEPALRPDRWLPEFFPAALQRVWWHALRGEEIVLLTGTLAPLADAVKAALQRELLWRGVTGRVAAIATRLLARNDCWTGSIAGRAVVGEAKAAAAARLAALRGIPLGRCFAYGDHALDGGLLAAVGNPFAVNASPGLRQIAIARGWPALSWSRCESRCVYGTSGAGGPWQSKGEARR